MKSLKTFFLLFLALSILLSFGSVAFAGLSSAEQQVNLIYTNLFPLAQETQGGNWFYAVTDFDHNGRLELLAASGQGSESRSKVWEVNEDCTALVKCGSLISSDESLPEMLTESADTYYNPADGSWSYRYNDAESTNDAYNSKVCSLKLLGGNFVYQLYASQSSEMMNGLIVVTFTDANGNIITPDEFNSAAANAFNGCQRSSTSFGWFRLTDAQSSSQVLTDSYDVFTGEKEPDEESVIREETPVVAEIQPVPAQTPEKVDEPVQTEKPLPSTTAEGYEIIYYDGPSAPEIVYPTEQPYEPVQPVNPIIVYPTPTPTPKFIPLTITRNPTNEYRREGSLARFVACASTFNGLTWRFVDPSGNEVSESEFRSYFPGSSIDSSSTTLSISNVTSDMDGWGAYCVFYTNDGQTGSTSTAYIVMK